MTRLASRCCSTARVYAPNPGGYAWEAFVCETKQSVAREAKDPLSLADPAAPKARRKSGTSVRGTAGWDDSMIAARGQAEGYVRALPDDNPPFLLVIDIGHSFELYADFSRPGKVYTAFPDARSHRFSLADLRDEAIRQRLTTLWLDPLSLDPARHAAKVTREIAARIAVLARRLEAKQHDPESVAWFLIRCLFTFFSEDVCLTPRGGFTSLLESLKESPEQFVPLVSEVWKTMGQGGFSTALRTRIKQFKGSIFRFTPRAYVERLVVPTIIEPIRDDWEASRAASLAEANAGRLDQAKAETRKFLDGLTATKVLDPAWRDDEKASRDGRGRARRHGAGGRRAVREPAEGGAAKGGFRGGQSAVYRQQADACGARR